MAIETNRLPALPCRSCYRNEALREIHCVNTSVCAGAFEWPCLEVPRHHTSGIVEWGPDPASKIMASPQDVAAYRSSKVKALSISRGLLQSWQNFADHWETVCSSSQLKPIPPH
jgi:hypothetical protein